MLTLKTPFELCSKHFEKESLNINKDVQNAGREGNPKGTEKSELFSRETYGVSNF